MQKFDELKIDLVVLAGFSKKIPDDFVDKFSDRIINIHPALLPSFGGKGMYGMNVHKAVFDRSCQVSGATVHFVNKIYDDGKIIAQRCVDISEVKSPDEIAEKVLMTEHKLLPFVIGKISKGEVVIENNRVRILN
jgi:folate-dependent phosphoribosylglycinamide formyltransferase PurN